MSDQNSEKTLAESDTGVIPEGLEDTLIPCVDCAQEFVWTVGEQEFFRAKELQNPPKRCKPCKKAKNQRLDAIERAKLSGKRHVIEVQVDCAKCGISTTVPFYPSQGRPVLCRACFVSMKEDKAARANG